MGTLEAVYVMTRGGGLGTVAVAGTKAMVISWPFWNNRSWGGPLVSVPVLELKLDQLSTITTPGLPASGVPLGHTSPLVQTCLPGYCKVEALSPRPLYPWTNLPSVAFFPDSELFFGWMVTTPLPLAVRPVVAVLVLAGRLGCMVPQISIPNAANHCCEVVGGPAEEAVWWVRWYRLNPISSRPTMQMTARLAYQFTGIWPR